MAASPSTFFDPFFEPLETDLSQKQKLPLDNAWSGITHGIQKEQLLSIDKAAPDKKRTLPVTGQGTIAVLSDARERLLFSIKTATEGAPTLYLEIGQLECRMFYGDIDAGRITPIALQLAPSKPKESGYLCPGEKTVYWLSIDNGNGILRYGKHYTNTAQTLLSATLKKKGKDPVSGNDGVMVWIHPKEHAWLASLKTVKVIQDKAESPEKIKIKAVPVVLDRSPYIISDQKISLQQLESNAFTVPANLPPECQILYQNVGGPNIVLNTQDFPEFGKAIQRSVTTDGLWGYELLKSKAKEFGGEDIKGTYLRITLGTNMGNSPGIPYVLEIWPYGHYSPIHDHGESCAIIKILYGDLRATYYDTLESTNGPQPLGPPIMLREGDVTWIGGENYQIHKLENDSVTQSVCCTIQCYMYPKKDKAHYEYFNYVTAEKKKSEEFTPNSDATFTELYNQMKKEWQEYRMPKESNL